MKTLKYPLEQLKPVLDLLSPQVEPNLPIVCRLWGSRLYGTQDEHSDIDVAVVVFPKLTSYVFKETRLDTNNVNKYLIRGTGEVVVYVGQFKTNPGDIEITVVPYEKLAESLILCKDHRLFELAYSLLPDDPFFQHLVEKYSITKALGVFCTKALGWLGKPPGDPITEENVRNLHHAARIGETAKRIKSNLNCFPLPAEVASELVKIKSWKGPRPEFLSIRQSVEKELVDLKSSFLTVPEVDVSALRQEISAQVIESHLHIIS